MTIDEYLALERKTILYIRYNKEDKMDYMYYENQDGTDIKCHVNDIIDKDLGPILYWDIQYTKDDNFKKVSIMSSYVTKDHIMHLINRNHNGKLCNFRSAEIKDEAKQEYTYILSNDKDKEVELTFDASREIIIYSDSTSKLLKVYNIDTCKFEETHYIDENMYYIINHIENSETLYKDGKNIVYEFGKRDLSISSYLQYHHPTRVTDYDMEKQYILEYDNYGIMTSMVEISDPNTNLCTYEKKNLVSDTNFECTSIHPDIYNPFSTEDLAVDFMTNKTMVVETFTNFFPVESSSYKRKVVNLE